MPWIEAMLRGQKVFAKASADGKLAAEDGRVEIRYRPNDGKAYRAAAGNLVVAEGAPTFPDEHCVAEGAGVKREAQGAGREAQGAGREAQGASAGAGAGAGAGASANAGPRWLAYTDGACSGNPGPAGAGMIVIQPDGKMHEGFEYLGEATNNIAELTAILRAVEALPPEATNVVVHTDSQYSIGVIQKNWKAKANQELVARTKRAVEARGVKLAYVRGHDGHPMNERADELAREAITARRSQAIAPLG